MQKFINKKTIVVLIILLVIGYGAAFYYFHQYKRLTMDPNAVAKQETAQLVAAVSKLMLLPVGEAPSIATVENREKLSSEPFFVNALNGDKVLIYYTAKKAFLYRPSTNQVINAAPLTMQNTDTVGNPVPAQTAPTAPVTAPTPKK